MGTVLTELVILLGIRVSFSAEPAYTFEIWMINVPDALLLSEMTIPGTHNSLALYGSSYAKCQNWDLPTQLIGGIRYLDVGMVSSGAIYSGGWNQNVHLDDVIKNVVDFLEKYPSETVLIRIKKEDPAMTNSRQLLENSLSKHTNSTKLWTRRSIPILGEVRGKIVILQDFEGDPYGIPYSSLVIQDEAKVDNVFQLQWKFRRVKEQLENAIKGDRPTMFITYTSGNGMFANPGMVSPSINPWVETWLRNDRYKYKRLGIIAMDYPYSELIGRVMDFQLREL